MPGRQDFSTPGSKGSAQTVAVNNRPEIAVVERSLDPVPAGEQQTTEVYAPTGSVYNLKSMYLVANSIGAATNGIHQFKIRPVGQYATHIGTSTFDQFLTFKSGWQEVDESKRLTPTSEAAAVVAQEQLQATENRPISIKYRNQTDADQTRAEVKIIAEEESY